MRFTKLTLTTVELLAERNAEVARYKLERAAFTTTELKKRANLLAKKFAGIRKSK